MDPLQLAKIRHRLESRANLHQGNQASVIKITVQERKLAIKAAKALNLAVAGVDIIRSNKGRSSWK